MKAATCGAALCCALALAGCASASPRWAGLTRAEAIVRARVEVSELAASYNGWSQAAAARFAATLRDPHATEVTCGGAPAWRVVFGRLSADNGAAYVARDRLFFVCR